MTSTGLRRFARLSALAWISMVGVLGVIAAVKWNQPGLRDPDISGPFEMALIFMMVSAIPFALIAVLVLAPLAALIDSLVEGRLPLTWNAVIGAMLALPALAVFLLVGLFLYGQLPNTNIATLSVGLTVFAVGGVVTSLAMRHSAGTSRP